MALAILGFVIDVVFMLIALFVETEKKLLPRKKLVFILAVIAALFLVLIIFFSLNSKNGPGELPIADSSEMPQHISASFPQGFSEQTSKEESSDAVVTHSEVLIDATTKEPTQTTLQQEQFPASEKTPVISVIGKSATDAQSALIGQGFKVNLAYSYSKNVATGNVISQDPSAGSFLEKGASVTITISNGQEMISVANVIGKSLSEAKTNLTDQGFYVASSEEYSSHPSGTVIRQSPSAGSPLEKGGTVSVVISKGKQPVIVSFNATGGAVSLSSKTVYVSDPYGELPTPSRNAFVFVGWFTENGEGVSNETTVSNTNGHTLYAHWEEVIPSYLSYYSAPSSLGSDLHKPIVSIEGDLYQFPCPVRAFLKNGWSGNDLDDIEDNTYNFSLTLTRNGKTLHLGNVSNHWTESTTVRNCVVEGIIIDNDPSEAWNSSINTYLPNNITLGSSREYVLSVLPSDFEKDTDAYGRVFYRYTMSNPFGHTIITMDQTNSYVVGINVCKFYN